MSGGWCKDPDLSNVLGDDPHLSNGYAQEGNGHFITVFNIENFMPRDEFHNAMDTMVSTLNNCPTENQVEKVLVAGQKEAEIEKKRREYGIPVNEITYNEIKELASRYHINPPKMITS